MILGLCNTSKYTINFLKICEKINYVKFIFKQEYFLGNIMVLNTLDLRYMLYKWVL